MVPGAVAEGRGAILKDHNERILQIEREGCPIGRVREEKIKTLQKCADDQKDINEKIFGEFSGIKKLISDYAMRFLIMMTILAVLAGINVASILHLIPK